MAYNSDLIPDSRMNLLKVAINYTTKEKFHICKLTDQLNPLVVSM